MVVLSLLSFVENSREPFLMAATISILQSFDEAYTQNDISAIHIEAFTTTTEEKIGDRPEITINKSKNLLKFNGGTFEETELTEIFERIDKVNDLCICHAKCVLSYSFYKSISKLLKNNNHLVELTLHNIKMFDNDLEYISKALAENTALTTLDLSDNNLTDKGLRNLYDNLTDSTGSKLDILDISGNPCQGTAVGLLETIIDDLTCIFDED